MTNGIVMRQNEDKSIAMLAAQRQLYSDAKKLNMLNIALAVWMPFSLSLLILLFPENKVLQIASYILSIVSMVFAFVVDKLIDSKKKLAAFIQQKFDVYVYAMPWNDRIFGKDKNVNREIAMNSKRILDKPQEKNRLYDWYTPVVDDRSLEDGILLCQRENFGWDIGLRKRFRFISVVLIIVLTILVFGMGLLKNESVAELLCRLAFVAPMAGWLFNTVKQLNKDIEALKELDEDINDNTKKTMDDLQDIQKVIFEHRKECYAIPDCVYELFKDNDEDKAHREASM